MWNICGETLESGEKRQFMLEPGIEGYEIPTTLICGAKPGKTLLVTGGIHSGEYPGVAAAIRLASEIDPEKVAGNVILMHCVNTSGFWARTPSVLPEDGFNLNHDYPGEKDGTTGSKIAYYFMTALFPEVDFIFDLHSGSGTEVMTPLVFYTNAEGPGKVALSAAKALDLSHLVASEATKGEYSYAAHHYGIPGLLMEIGHSTGCRKDWINLCYRNIKLLMQHLGMADFGEKKTVKEQYIYEKAIYLDAEESGLWYPAVTREENIRKGQLLGHMEDFFGNRIKSYYAEADGKVLYYTDALSAPKGTFLAAYGLRG